MEELSPRIRNREEIRAALILLYISVQKHIPFYKCEACHKIFKAKCNYRRHRIFHCSQPKPYVCTTCKFVFTNLTSLSRHMLKHNIKHKMHMNLHREFLNCKFCKDSFNIAYEYINHMRMHYLGREYDCMDFIKNYTCNTMLNEHLTPQYSHTEPKTTQQQEEASTSYA